MRSPGRAARRRGAAAACLAAAAASLAAGAVVSAASAEGTALESSTTLAVADATLAWEVNKQTQARSHNPLAINLLSAGVADPGRGGADLRSSQWRAVEGNVAIQKRDAAGAWQSATWDGLSTDATGSPIGVSGPYSGHRVLLGAGAGTVDPATDTARLEWRGTFSVVYYGGNSIFTATDPVLELTAGTGTLTAALGGWNGDRNDPTVWTPAAPQRVSIADVSGVDVTETGALAVPAYGGVQVTGTVPQVRDEAGWGSFPAPMVAHLGPLGGIDQFWYSTGLSTDSTKTPEPIALGWGGSAPVEAGTTAATPTPTTAPTNTVKNPPRSTPTPRPTPTRDPVTQAPPATVAPAPVTEPPVAPAPVAAVPQLPVVQQPPVQLTAAEATEPAAAAPAGADALGSAPWWIGGALFLAAGLLLLVPGRRAARA